MIPISSVATTILAGNSYQVHHRLSSWRNGICLAEDIPAVDVSEEQDATMRVPERLTFRVPVVDDEGNTWVPTSYASPLGIWGQRIVSQIGLSVGNDEIEWINRGVFLLESANTGDDAVSVECLGLMQLLDEAMLATEFQPTTGATYGSTLRQLIEPGIMVDLDSAPTDITVPTSAVTWSDNRLDDIYTILDAWPAQIKQTAEGHLEVLPIAVAPTLLEIEFAFTDALGGTVVEWNTELTRDGAFNCVIAEGAYDDNRGALAGLPIVHTALDLDPASPFTLGGDFSPYLVPEIYSNPLLNEHVPVLLAATTRLADLRRKATNTVSITAVPHPAIKLGDAVSVTSARLGISNEYGRVVSFTLPHTADGGGMSVSVRLQGLI